jgi:hypothetical protein
MRLRMHEVHGEHAPCRKDSGADSRRLASKGDGGDVWWRRCNKIIIIRVGD